MKNLNLSAASAAPARATAQQSIAPDYLKPVPQDSSVQTINYFLNPHAEADGKPVQAERTGVSKI